LSTSAWFPSNPDNGDTTVSVRNVDGDISLRRNLVDQQKPWFNKFVGLRFQFSLSFLRFIQRTINFDTVIIIEEMWTF